jgi:hypothetical protein
MEMGPIKFLGTIGDPAAAIILATDQGGYALTPADLPGFRDRLIELLEATPGVPAGEPESAMRGRGLPILSPLELGRALRWTAGTAVVAALVWAMLQMPMDVPDTNSPPAGNQNGTANDWTSTGQTFVPSRNGLDQISLVLATDEPSDRYEVTFNLKDAPKGTILRTVKRPLSTVPKGDPGDMRPGTRREQWYSFNFDPIPDSAGRKLYFSVEGKGIPRENTVKVMMFYHSGYPLGEAYRNEQPENAHVVFRTYCEGKLADYVNVLAENLTRGRPGPLANPLTYLGLGLLYVGLVALLLRTVIRIGKQSAPPAP